MAGEEQERFEDYLELERYIEDLQAGRRASPPKDLTSGQARIYRMAALFRSASPEAATPRPEFMEELHARLLALDEEKTEPSELAEEEGLTPDQDEHHIVPLIERDVPDTTYKEPPPTTEKPAKKPEKPPKKRLVSRRSLLTGGAVAAASLAAGAGIGAVVQQNMTPEPPPVTTLPNTSTVPLVTRDTPAGWLFVGTLKQLEEGAIQFVTNTIIGFVVRNEGERKEVKLEKSPILAMSAACTHMGCILQWQKSEHQFVCPCHEGYFTANGRPYKGRSNSFRYYASLPLMETKVEDGNIYVKVPTYSDIKTT